MRNVRLIAKLRAAKTEIRSPKSERSAKPETRNAPGWPTPGTYYSTTRQPAEHLRFSDFIRISDFGLRISCPTPRDYVSRFTFHASFVPRPQPPNLPHNLIRH